MSARDNDLLIGLSIRSLGGCLALVPKSPVHTFFTFVGCYTFVSRPSRSTSHPASRWTAGLTDTTLVTVMSSALGRTAVSARVDFLVRNTNWKLPRRGGLPRPPAVTDMNVYAMNTTHVLKNIVYFGPSKLPILDGFTS